MSKKKKKQNQDVLTCYEYVMPNGSLIGKTYSNGLKVIYADDTEYWFFKDIIIDGIHTIEGAFKHLELRAFW